MNNYKKPVILDIEKEIKNFKNEFLPNTFFMPEKEEDKFKLIVSLLAKIQLDVEEIKHIHNKKFKI